MLSDRFLLYYALSMFWLYKNSEICVGCVTDCVFSVAMYWFIAMHCTVNGSYFGHRGNFGHPSNGDCDATVFQWRVAKVTPAGQSNSCLRYQFFWAVQFLWPWWYLHLKCQWWCSWWCCLYEINELRYAAFIHKCISSLSVLCTSSVLFVLVLSTVISVVLCIDS